MTNVLVLQSDPLSPLALVGEELGKIGFELKVRRCAEGDAVTKQDLTADGLIVLGGPQSVIDPKHVTLMQTMMNAVKVFHATDRPILGICLGAQVIAKALGGDVRRHEELQFGFKQLAYSKGACDDSILKQVTSPVRVFCWHEDHVTLPENARLLASTSTVENCIFRLGERTYGFQCHFEAMPVSLKAMLDRGRHLVPKNLGDKGYQLLDEIEQEIKTYLETAMNFGARVTENWAGLFLKAPAVK
ncbi:MAG: type 1 glutamine amidotransferase [Alphaproteobacteria bacterium]